MSVVETRRDQKRGCGWRKPGGLYLVSTNLAAPCGKLPIPLSVCPTCHAGVKPSRSWTWIDADALMATSRCTKASDCGGCPMAQPMGTVGLLWVGGQFYPTPSDWTREALTQGISRRIPALPKGFKLGTTWVFVAHREAIPAIDGEATPAIFHAFKPTAVEFVVRGSETDDELAALKKRGITPVRIERVDDDRATLPLSTSNGDESKAGVR